MQIQGTERIKGRAVPERKRLLLIADCGVDTGFGSVSHNIIENLHTRWDIDVLAVNYYGDPHPIQKLARLWSPTAVQMGDVYGMARLPSLVQTVKPDVILLINDPWICAEYTKVLKNIDCLRIAYVPIDAENIKPIFAVEMNKAFDHIIAYTNFGKQQLKEAGVEIPMSVIPHGINKSVYFPLKKDEVRKNTGLDPNWYVVQMVGRNQIRKRIDLGIYYFSEWVKRTNKPDSVKFYYHGAVIDEGWDLAQIMQACGTHDRLILSHKNLNPAHGFPVEAMKMVYNIADVQLSTCMGEGWGLTAMESMACGIPQIVPNYSALGEWCRKSDGTPVVYYTDISPIPYFNTRGLNTRGGVPDMESTIAALETMYQDKVLRESLGVAGYQLVSQPQFEWKNIAREFEKTFLSARRYTSKGQIDDA